MLKDTRLIYNASDPVRRTFNLIIDCYDAEISHTYIKNDMFQFLYDIKSGEVAQALPLSIAALREFSINELTDYEFSIIKSIQESILFFLFVRDIVSNKTTRVIEYLQCLSQNLFDDMLDIEPNRKCVTSTMVFKHEDVSAINVDVQLPKMCDKPTGEYNIMLVHFENHTQMQIPAYSTVDMRTLHDAPVSYVVIPNSLAKMAIELFSFVNNHYSPESEIIADRLVTITTREKPYVTEVYTEACERVREKLPNNKSYASLLYKEWLLSAN